MSNYTTLSVASLVGLLATATAMPAERQKPSATDALALAQQYLSKWEETLIALVAEERYTQEVKTYRRFNASGASQWIRSQERTLTSDVLVLRSPAEKLWISFRDVKTVDDKAVHDRQRRFDELFSGPEAGVLASAERIAAEGARYNLGRFPRTLNTPIAPLIFLKPTYAANTDWKLETDARLDERNLWALIFDQRRPPFVLRIQGDRPYPASGRFLIDPADGRIHLAALLVTSNDMAITVVIRYGPVAAVPAWVPLRMEDGYQVRRTEIVSGVAQYSKHRLFQTSVRIVGD
jgi:hypothetical protein